MRRHSFTASGLVATRTSPQNWIAGSVAVVLVLLLAGCSANGTIDNTPAPVVLIAGNLTPTSTPFGDVLTSSGTIPDDSVQIDFVAKMKNPADLTQPGLQDIVLERYEVTFARVDGGTAVPAGFTRAINSRVRVTPHGQQNEFITTVSLTILPSTTKTQPPISHLISAGFEPGTGYINIQLNATIRFFGHTVSGDAISAQAAIGINIANFADSN